MNFAYELTHKMKLKTHTKRKTFDEIQSENSIMIMSGSKLKRNMVDDSRFIFRI